MSKDGEKELAKINESHKRTIVVKLSCSHLLTNEEKKKLQTEVLGGDLSDIAKNTLLTCQAAIADVQNKEQVWKDITDPKSTLSSEQKGALMEGFWIQDQLELLRPFFDRYFETIPEIESQHGFKYLGMFCS